MTPPGHAEPEQVRSTPRDYGDQAHRREAAKKRGFEQDGAQADWVRIRLGHAPKPWHTAGVADLAAQTILGLQRPNPPPSVTPARTVDPFRGVANKLVAALAAAHGKAAKEERALRAAIKGYVSIAKDGDPHAVGVTHYLAEDGSADSPPALERVPGCTEADTFRWREKLCELVGH